MSAPETRNVGPFGLARRAYRFFAWRPLPLYAKAAYAQHPGPLAQRFLLRRSRLSIHPRRQQFTASPTEIASAPQRSSIDLRTSAFIFPFRDELQFGHGSQPAQIF